MVDDTSQAGDGVEPTRPSPSESPASEGAGSGNVLPFPTRPAVAPPVTSASDDSPASASSVHAVASAFVDGFMGSVNQARLEADLAAIDHPRVFRRRFWFLVNETGRRKVVQFQRRADLTDFEVALLHHTGSLDLEAPEPRITAPRALWWFGQAVAVFFATLAVAVFAATIFQTKTPPARSFLPLAGTELALALVIHGAQLWWARPWMLRCRVEEHLAQPRASQ